MSEPVAQDQLRAFVERVLRMREEAKAINDDIREIYAEAKASGFDKTVMGQLVSFLTRREKDPAALAEQSAIFDLYLAAYDGHIIRDDEETGTVVATHTHEAIPAHDAETGEIDEPLEGSPSKPEGEQSPSASTVYQFRPKPHDGPVNSRGLACPMGCLNIEACAGKWDQRCFTCERAWNDGAASDGAAA